MSRRRTPQQEMAAWKRRVEDLLRKESRCPACIKRREKFAGTIITTVCDRHQEIRRSMALTEKRRFGYG